MSRRVLIAAAALLAACGSNPPAGNGSTSAGSSSGASTAGTTGASSGSSSSGSTTSSSSSSSGSSSSATSSSSASSSSSSASSSSSSASSSSSSASSSSGSSGGVIDCGGSTGTSGVSDTGSSGAADGGACADGTQDGDETDVDCGGSCAGCGPGLRCTTDSDCATHYCADGGCDVQVSPISLPPGANLSSVDSADGTHLVATLDDWSLISSSDGARTWHLRYVPSSTGESGYGHVHVSRADPNQVLVSALHPNSCYDPMLEVSHDGLNHTTQSTNGVDSWGDVAAFSAADPTVVYLFGDNGGSERSTNAGDSFSSISATAPGGLWFGGSAAVDPLSSERAFIAETVLGGGPTLTLYDNAAGSETDLTAAASAALGGAPPAGLEVYRTGPCTFRMRLVSSDGMVAVSDDDGATFRSVGGGGLAGCDDYGTPRQITSDASNRDAVATWCPLSGQLAYSDNGGQRWNLLQGASWTKWACSQISGVVMNDSDLVVACDGNHSLRVAWAGGRPTLADGGALPATCADGTRDGDESDVDCGGSCPPCALSASCLAPADCLSGNCAGASPDGGRCAAPSCTDGVRDGFEAGVDCGGTCAGCPTGTPCEVGQDCGSGVCGGNRLCAAPTCSDGVKNGTETDVDCGGTCAGCLINQGCDAGSDCESGVCTSHLCDLDIATLTAPDAGTTFSSIDSADGTTLWATDMDWAVLASTDGAVHWSVKYLPRTSEQYGEAKIHVNRADPRQLLVYGYTDTQTSTYDANTIVSHDGFASATEPDNGTSSWGDMCGFSASDPEVIYYLGDNGPTLLSLNAGDTTATLGTAIEAGGLWTAGWAEVDPLDSDRVFACAAGGGESTTFGVLDRTAGFTDLTAAVSAALGQPPGGFEVYPTGSGAYRMRVVGLSGGIAISDDDGVTFTPVSTSTGLPACGSWAGKVRQIASYAGDRNRVVTWCPKTDDLAVSSNGGLTWTPATSAPGWGTRGCSSISGAALTGSQVVVACTTGASLRFSY